MIRISSLIIQTLPSFVELRYRLLVQTQQELLTFPVNTGPIVDTVSVVWLPYKALNAAL
jgi:hypothetical protein